MNANLGASEKGENTPAMCSLSLGKKLEESHHFLNPPHNPGARVGNAAADCSAPGIHMEITVRGERQHVHPCCGPSQHGEWFQVA